MNHKAKKKPMNGGLVKGNNLTIENIQPKTPAQEEVFDAYDDGLNLLLHGMPGTGKTFLSMYLALESIINEEYNNLVIVRTAVPGRDIGALPGEINEKIAAYEEPYIGICNELFGRGDAYGILKKKGVIDFRCTSFLRGINLDNSVVLVDECQNYSFQELDTVINRVGPFTRVIFAGDMMQDDLTSKRYHEESGLDRFMELLDYMTEFERIEFGVEDIVRSGLVKSYIIAKEKLGFYA